MNGLTAAKGLRRSVEEAGGSMRISVNALGDAFGRGKLTARAKTGIEHVLLRAGVTVEPALPTVATTDWVTLALATPVESSADGLGFARLPTTIAAALTFALLALPAAALVLPDGGDEPAVAAAPVAPRTTPVQVPPAPPAAPAAPLDRAREALAGGEYLRAVELARRADPTLAGPMRARAATALLFDARVAQRAGEDRKAIALARRAARYGAAPGAKQLVRRSQARLRRSSRTSG